MAINSCVFVGRLTADIEPRCTQSSVAVCNFTIAVDRQYRKDEERLTDWIDCVAWRGTAGFVSKYFHKGDMIAVIGKMQTRNWEDQNGNKRKSTECVVDEVSFVGGRNNNASSEQKVDELVIEEPASEESKDDLPF